MPGFRLFKGKLILKYGFKMTDKLLEEKSDTLIKHFFDIMKSGMGVMRNMA